MITAESRADGRLTKPRGFWTAVWVLFAAGCCWLAALVAVHSGWGNGEASPPWAYQVVVCGGLALLFVLAGAVLLLGTRAWAKRWRVMIMAVVVALAALALAPFWLGYFGPAAAAHSAVWRPWRTGVSVEVLQDGSGSAERVEAETLFDDHRPELSGGGLQPYVTLERPSPLLPWIATRYYYTLL